MQEDTMYTKNNGGTMHLLKLLNLLTLMTMIILINALLPYFPAHKTHTPLEKCDPNSTCVLCAEGKYYFQTYKYPYIYYTVSLSWDSENNHEDDFGGSDDDFLGFYDE